jgi:hypothetical protein
MLIIKIIRYFFKIAGVFTKTGLVYCCVLLFLNSKIYAESVLVCHDELATGFFKQNGVWQQGEFQLDRFTLKVPDNFSTITDSKSNSIFSCFVDSPWESYHPVICKNQRDNWSSTFNIDKISLRYVRTNISAAGYASTSKYPKMDVILAGKCERF